MIFVTDKKILASCTPNVLREAQGEASLFDKITPWLEESEAWLINNIIGECADLVIEVDVMLKMARRIVCAMAMFNAVPNLDLVLTANGFGIVNTGNIAPASKERVDRLRSSLKSLRDLNIDLFLNKLLEVDQWRGTAVGSYYTRSVFPRPFFLDINCDYEQYKAFREKSDDVELTLAERAVSFPLMGDLTSKKPSQLSREETYLIALIRQCVRLMIQGEAAHVIEARVSQLVNYIRSNPALFPQWQTSTTAELYNPIVYKNKKESSGFWF